MSTVIVGGLVFALVGWAVWSSFFNKKSKGGCGCGCSGCGMEDSCHPEKK